MSNVALEYIFSREITRLAIGTPVCIAAAGGVLMASAANALLLPCIGMVASVSFQSFRRVKIQSSGQMTRQNWTPIVGSELLIPNSSYYLAVTPGKITLSASEPGALSSQIVASAVTTTTLMLQIVDAPTAGPVPSIMLTDQGNGKVATITVVNGATQLSEEE